MLLEEINNPKPSNDEQNLTDKLQENPEYLKEQSQENRKKRKKYSLLERSYEIN